jgi:hypothetical protein
MESHRRRRGGLESDIAWAATGAAFSVIALVAFLIARGPSEPDGRGVFTYFSKHETAVDWQALLFGIAAILLLWFAGTIAHAARTTEATARDRAHDARRGTSEPAAVRRPSLAGTREVEPIDLSRGLHRGLHAISNPGTRDKPDPRNGAG